MSRDKNSQRPTTDHGRQPLNEDLYRKPGGGSNDYGECTRDFDVVNSMPPPRKPDQGGGSDNGQGEK